jgi:peptidoglycan/LPS O-acetylase OafA/YrhL
MKYLPALDGLRAVAILSVVASHLITSMVPGSFGVTLFFFISGFIITRLLFSEHFESLLPFYVRRFFRLGPALFVYTGSCVLAMFLLHREIVWRDVSAALFYYANYNDPRMVSMSTMWSLAVEEHFYLLFPPLFLLLRKDPVKLQRLLVLVIVAALLYRFNMVRLDYPFEHILRHTESRLDSIAFGCLLAVMAHRDPDGLVRKLGGRRMLGVAFVILCIATLPRSEEFRETLRYSLQGVAFFILFCHLFFSTEHSSLRMLLQHPWLVFIGKISYSLYLYHEFGLILGTSFGSGRWSTMAIALLVTIPTTLMSYNFVELPIRRWGSNLAHQIAVRRSLLIR